MCLASEGMNQRLQSHQGIHGVGESFLPSRGGPKLRVNASRDGLWLVSGRSVILGVRLAGEGRSAGSEAYRGAVDKVKVVEVRDGGKRKAAGRRHRR